MGRDWGGERSGGMLGLWWGGVGVGWGGAGRVVALHDE